MPNWKKPGSDFVQGFWLKNFKIIQELLRRNLQKCLETGSVLMWMTKGRTMLLQKDKEKGKPSSNYRPITCLSLIWKLLAGVIPEETYAILYTNLLLPQEKKGCRRKCRGTNDLLLTDKLILKEVKMSQWHG